MPIAKGVHVVYAEWCLHCVPATVDPIKKAAADLGIACHLYDIETDEVKKADELVRKYGDWSEDYLIPQVFIEFENGEIRHVLTGRPEGVEFTQRAVANLLSSEFFDSIQQIPSRKKK